MQAFPQFRAASLQKIISMLFCRTGTLATQAIVEDICVVFTKICRSCCLHDGILNDGMYAETLKIHLPKASGFIFTYSYSKPMIISPVSLCVRLKFFFLEHFQPRHFYCLRFCLFCFRLKSSIRNKTGTHVFWENEVDYLRVSPGAHPLAKKAEDSRYEIDIKQIDSMLRWVCLVIDHRRRENVVRTSVKNSDIYVMVN